MKLIMSFITGVVSVFTILVLWCNSTSPEGFVWSLICVGALVMFTVLLTAEVLGYNKVDIDNTPPP